MKAVFSTEDLNSYGFYVKTSGIDLGRFKKNPVLTFNHNTYNSVGKVNNLNIEDGKLVGEIEFDTEDSTGKELSRKYAKGYMSGFSIGIRVLELSDKDLKHNQTRSTVSKSELIEIAAATIPANSNAVKLYNDAGNVVELSATGLENFIPLINKKMKATEEKIEKEQKDTKEVSLNTEKDKELEAMFIELGKSKGAIDDENKELFEKLFGLDRVLAKSFVELLAKKAGDEKGEDSKFAIKDAKESLSDFLNSIKQGVQENQTKKWAEYTEQELEDLRNKNVESYKKLFVENYGFEPEL